MFKKLIILLMMAFGMFNIPAAASPTTASLPATGPLASVPDIDYNEIAPNEMGNIMIIMYHGLVTKKPHAPYQRTAEDFKKDLYNLYSAGYRLVSLNDIIDNNISVPAGTSPVAFVFDDGINSTFALEEDASGSLVSKEGCMVDIMQKFAAEYPDFGNTATFAIIGIDEPFEGAGTVAERLKYLIDNGYDIANHTNTHANLKKLGESELQKEIGSAHNSLTTLLPEGYVIRSLVYPYGQRPKTALREFAIKGAYDNVDYNYDIALREGQSGASITPGHIDFDPLNAPRVRASENAETDLGWCIEYYKNNPIQRYVSDGDPNTISVPKEYESKINFEDKRLFGKEIIIY